MIRKISNEPVRRICKEFAQELDKMREIRVRNGKDEIKSIKADWRLTLALVRHPMFKLIKEDIVKADLK